MAPSLSLLVLLVLPSRAAAGDRPRVERAVGAVRKAGDDAEAKAFARRVRRAERDAASEGGCMVVGKVALAGAGDPEAVGAQMRVFPGGYFADAYDPQGAPLGFRAPGYDPVDARPECQDGFAWLDVALRLTPERRRGALKARLVAPGLDLSRTDVRVWPLPPPPNEPRMGVDGREPCRVGGPCPSIPGPRTEVSPDGALSASGLSPMEHSLWVQAPGFVSVLATFTVTAGGTTDLGEVRLEKARRLTVRYLVADRLPFRGEPRVSSAAAGQPWSTEPDSARAWSEVVFGQKDGVLTILPGTGPSSIADLGPGTLEELAPKASAAPESRVPRLPLVEGHAYLIRERYLKRWVLLSASAE